MDFEQDVLTKVTEARANAVAAGCPGPRRPGPGRERPDRDPALAVRGRRELPDLKANENVLSLQEQLTTTENQIGFSRQHYNATVLDYNNGIQTFPAVLLAGPLGFTKREFFEAEPEAQEVPVVALSLSRAPVAPAPRALEDADDRPLTDDHDLLQPDRRRTGAQSVFLRCRVVALLGVLGFAIGYALTGSRGRRSRRRRSRS